VTYDDGVDRPHLPTDDADWQESDWLCFYDAAAGVGGIFRAGQKPNRHTAQPGLFVFALGGSRFYLKGGGGGGLDVELGPQDRASDGYRVGGHWVTALGGGRQRYEWDYPETQADLVFSDAFYPPRDWSTKGKGEESIRTLNPDGHLECGGRLRGAVTIDGQKYQVDCFAHRDRSWGVRRLYVGRVKRILSTWATNGTGYSHAVMRFEPNDGPAFTTGFVVRDGVAVEARDLRMLTVIADDYVSAVAGRAIITLDTSEEVEVDVTLAQCHAGRGPGSDFIGVGTFVRDGVQGFACNQNLVNPSGGSHVSDAEEVSLAATEHGLSATAEHPSFAW
jgi:hypothetical protein